MKNRSQLRALTDLASGFAQVFFASIVLPIVVSKFDFNQIPMLLLGLIATLYFSYLSLVFAKKGKL